MSDDSIDEGTTRPLRVDAERNRQKILVAAVEVLAKKGLDATLDDVAHHAGVGVGTVYRRFPDKDALVEALFSEQIELMISTVTQALEKPDAWAALVEFIENMCAQQACNRGLKQVLFASNVGRDHMNELRSQLAPLVDKLVANARIQGKLRSDAEELDLPMFIFMLGAVSEVSQELEPNLWRRYLQIILDGLLATSATTPLPVNALDPQRFDTAMRTWHKR